MLWVAVGIIIVVMFFVGAGPVAYIALAALIAVYFLGRFVRAKETGVVVDALDRDRKVLLKWVRWQADREGISPAEYLERLEQTERLQQMLDHAGEREPRDSQQAHLRALGIGGAEAPRPRRTAQRSKKVRATDKSGAKKAERASEPAREPKECPDCKLINPGTALRCDCGHVFHD